MLKVKSLYLENFKKFNKIDLNFDKINIFIGNNGSGKSTIIEAITYGLLPFKIRNSINKIQHGKDEAFLKLTYELNNETYISEILFTKQKTYYKLSHKDLTINKSTEIQNFLNEKHLNEKILYNSCISKQHLSSSILDDSNFLLRTLLDMEILNEFELKFKDYIKDLENNKKNFISLYNTLNTKLEQLQKIQIKEVENLNFEKIRKILNLLIQKRNEYKNKLDLYLSLQTKLQKLEQLEKQIQNIFIISKNLEQYKILNIKLNNEKIKLNDHFNKYIEISKLRNKKAKTLKEILKLKHKLKRTYNPIFEKAIFQKIDKTKKLLTKLETKLYNTKNYIDLLKKGKCPTCYRPFNNIEALQKILEKKYIFYNKLFSNIKNIFDIYYKDYENYKFLLNSIEELKNQIIKLPNDNFKILRNVSIRYKKIEKILLKLTNRIKYLEQKMNQLNIIKNEYEKLKKEIPISILEKPKLFKKDKLIEKLSILLSKEEEYKKNIELKNLITNTKNEIHNINQSIHELDYKMNIISNLFTIYKKEFIPFCINSYLQKFEKFLNYILSSIFENYNLILNFNEKNLEIFMKNHYGIITIEELSGFEKQLISIALRLAFTFFFKFNFLILDEADESASEENSKLLYNLLNDFVLNKNIQLFLVSHKQYLKELPYVINVELL